MCFFGQLCKGGPVVSKLTLHQVYLEATACFPFIVANTFAKDI